MNKKVKAIACLLMIIIMILCLSYHTKIDAASVTLNINVTNDTATVEDTITATVKGSAEQWTLTLTANGTTIATSNNLTNSGSEIPINASGNYKATTEGTVTFVLTGDYSYTANGKVFTEEVNETKTVTIKAKTATQNPPTTVEPQPPVDNPTTEKPTEQKPATEPEPTFQEVNEKVYATTSGVNVRESYSTSSKSIGTLKEGQEYTRTGKGSNDWSRISYNGKTAYVYSKYLTTTKPVVEEKSNNANLKSLVVENHDIIPSFSSSTTSYTMQVTNDVTELTIKAEAEDAKATVSVKGEKDLKEGENIVTISVSAEDGTTKTYEVKVTKLPETTLSLQTLNIEGTDIKNEFQPDIYEYEIQFRELTKLNIEAIANEETAKVEIIGNEDLEEGENIITIIVSSEDESEKVTYQIKAKKLVANTTTQEEKENLNPSIYLYIAIGTILLVALIIVIIYTIKNRKQEDYEEEEFEEFPGELPERQEDVKDNDRENGRGKHF